MTENIEAYKFQNELTGGYKLSNYQNLSGILAELQELLNKSSELNNVNLNLLSKLSEDGSGNLFYQGKKVVLDETPSSNGQLLSDFKADSVGYDYATVSWVFPNPQLIKEAKLLLNNQEYHKLLPTDTTYNITQLVPETRYSIGLIITDHNDVSSEWGFDITTQAHVIPSPPPSIRYFVTTSQESDCIALDWSIINYEKATSLKLYVDDKEVESFANNVSGHVLFGLDADTEYKITLAITGDDGYSQSSDLIAKTKPAPESQVPNIQNAEFHAMTRDEQTIDLGWLGFENVTSFDLLVNDTYRVTIDGTETSHTFTGLDAATEYKFTIIARNDVGSANPIFAITSTLSA